LPAVIIQEMTTDERIDRLTGIVETLAATVAAHDNSIEAHDRQIEALIAVAEKQDSRLRTLAQAIEDMSRQWQAYLNTLPRQ
jgi:chromosome segregation ATPase